MKNMGLLIVRLTVGGLLAGHGAQKLFGWFEGPGMSGTSGWLESMGFRPGRQWAFLAGASEFVGGILTAVGMLNPLGPLAAIGAMLMATVKVHGGKPIWATKGGAELTVTNTAALLAIALSGPGRWSIDHLLRIRLPRWLTIPGFGLVAATVWLAVRESEEAQREPEAADSTAGAEDESSGRRPEDEASDWPGPGDTERQDVAAARRSASQE